MSGAENNFEKKNGPRQLGLFTRLLLNFVEVPVAGEVDPDRGGQ